MSMSTYADEMYEEVEPYWMSEEYQINQNEASDYYNEYDAEYDDPSEISDNQEDDAW
jgi:hypothetical protein